MMAPARLGNRANRPWPEMPWMVGQSVGSPKRIMGDPFVGTGMPTYVGFFLSYGDGSVGGKTRYESAGGTRVWRAARPVDV